MSQTSIPLSTQTSSRTTDSSKVSATNLFYDDLIYGNPSFVKSPKRMGKLRTFFFIRNQPIIVIGFNKISFVFILQLILNVSFWFIYLVVLPKISWWFSLINKAIYGVVMVCHLFIFFFNPGIPSKAFHIAEYMKNEKYMRLSVDEKKSYVYCDICHIITHVGNDIQHCDDCNLCIMKYDHHCYWTGKCIGRNNKLFFYPFMFGSFAYIIAWFVTIMFWLGTTIKGHTKI